jgi:hypothetical protein
VTRKLYRFEHPPQLVCLDCGKAVFGRIVKPFDLIENRECDICAAAGQVVHASVFRDDGEMVSRR